MKVEGDYTCDICGESFETNVEIAGHVAGHKRSITPDHIIEELRRVAEQKGRTPMQPEIEEETEFTAGAVQSTFGNWREGLHEAGLEPLNHSYSEDELIDELQRVAEMLGHSPSVMEIKRHGEVSPATVKRQFGSWNSGLDAAELSTTKSTKVTPQEVLTAIQALAEDLGRPPTAYEMDEQGEYVTKVAQRCFGSWNAALQEAGFDPHTRRNIPEEELLAKLSELRDQLGHVPSTVEMKEHGDITIYPYIRRYGSWKQAVEAAGMEYRGHPSGPDHPTWKGGYGDISYGPNWYKQRKGALERDSFECQMPGCSIDRETHRERWDRDLNVHHITPLGTFIDANGVLDYERANRLENLITLCQRHHMIWEEFAPLQPDIR
ncbi:HNH endonuclease [Halapricum desulfuricans]|nr:HNH endonuclease [Halapricum desulfuricans]